MVSTLFLSSLSKLYNNEEKQDGTENLEGTFNNESEAFVSYPVEFIPVFVHVISSF